MIFVPEQAGTQSCSGRLGIPPPTSHDLPNPLSRNLVMLLPSTTMELASQVTIVTLPT
jgi:hypothetical protein